jgi:amino acid adenylation domain-containing protein
MALADPRSIGDQTSQDSLSICTLLQERARENLSEAAILAVDRHPLTFAALFAFMSYLGKLMRGTGVTRTDRVAVVLPNGPEMATSFLAIASCAVCAPLNPNCRRPEFEFYFEDLQPRAAIVPAGSNSPAVAVAREMAIPILHLSSSANSPAGEFRLETEWGVAPPAATCEPSAPDDVALVLHTSGTASRPKMVPLTHRNLCHSAANVAEALQLGPTDCCLNMMPLFHIHGLVGALLSSLSARATVVCTPGFHAPTFFHWLARFRPTWYTAVPTMHQSIVQRSAQHLEAVAESRLRFIRSCSAPLPPSVLADLENVFRAPVIEAYGMTEAAHQVASNPLPPREHKSGSVGIAAGSEIAIMGDNGEVLAPGCTGEIVIRGRNVMSGYQHNPGAIRASFVNGWFRTGDQGWFDKDGYLYISGRTKEIINRAGEKISPRQVDEVLLEHPAVSQALAFAMPDATLGEEVAAAVVLRENQSANELQLREFVAARLADFKVPSRIVFVEDLPKGPTGKPQRIGLAEKLGIDRAKATSDARCGTPTETRLAQLWREVLGGGAVKPSDNFFEIGGDSILAMLLVSRVRRDFGIALSVVSAFQQPTLAAMAALIESVSKHDSAPAEANAPVAANGEGRLSFSQERMWFLANYEPDTPTYNRHDLFLVRGPLEVSALRRSLNAVVARHEVLRTNIALEAGRPVPVISPEREAEFEFTDVSEISGAERMAHSLELSRDFVRKPYDLARGPVLRVLLIKLAEDEHLLAVATHHIAFDGWSARVFIADLAAFYEAELKGTPPRLQELRCQYSQFAESERRRLESKAFDAAVSYWKDRLSGAPRDLGLPLDRPRPALQTSSGALETLDLASELVSELQSLSERAGVTLFIMLLAGFKLLLFRYSGSEDIVIGTPVANRNSIETEALIGPFTNTLPLRTSLAEEPTFRELLLRVRDTVLGGLAHQEVPFERIVEAVRPERDLSRAPLFQAVFQLRSLPFAAASLAGLPLERVELDASIAPFDLALDATPEGAGIHLALNYNTDLFQPATARRLLSHYATLLHSVVKHSERAITAVSLLPDEEAHLVRRWAGTARDYPQVCVHQLVERCARENPASAAVILGCRQWSYAELDRRANQIAGALSASGAAKGARVAICLRRSFDLIASVLGVLKTGAAFLLLDGALPERRLRTILEDAGPVLILTSADCLSLFRDYGGKVLDVNSLPATSRDVTNAGLDDPAYVMFTSGSSGRPKGVTLTHRGLVNYVSWLVEEFDIGPQDAVLQLSSIGFDPVLREIFGTLIAGARLVLVPDGDYRCADAVAEIMREQSITCVLAIVPTFLRALAREACARSGVPSLRLLMSCGEVLTRADWQCARESFGGGLLVANQYGPTECTMVSACYRIEQEPCRAVISIGRPVPNVEIYILDAARNPVPVGIIGEICIGGVGVGMGYINAPEMTSERFIANPFRPGTRMYRTGDLARYLDDGNIEFIGRADAQVKLRGHRIELGEVEAVLAQHQAIRSAAVALARPPKERLVAYVVPQAGHAPTDEALRAFLVARLPEHMVPAQFAFMSELPLTASGKLDRRGLPAVDLAEDEDWREYSAPAGAVERKLAEIFSAVLRVGAVGAEDNFFQLGGHSLLATQVVARIGREFSVELRLRQFFETPTVRALAAAVAQSGTPALNRPAPSNGQL